MASIAEYHALTAHRRGHITGRVPFQENRPAPFKRYADAPVARVAEAETPDVPLDRAAQNQPAQNPADLPAKLLACCGLAAGISQAHTLPSGRVFHLRTAPSAGALYPSELYVAVQDVIGIDDGVYHYSPLTHHLGRLRAGQPFARAGDGPMARFLVSSIFFRSAWKYGPRAYRYCLLDAGHLVQNLLLATAMHGLVGRPDYDFDDDAANAMLGVAPHLEGCLAMVHALGCDRTTPWADPPRPTLTDLPGHSRCAPRPDAPPELLDAHRATASFARCPLPRRPGPEGEFAPLPEPVVPASAASTIMARRSRRDFVPRQVAARDLIDILGLLGRPPEPDCAGVTTIGLLTGAESGLTPGRHTLHQTPPAVSLDAPGLFLSRSARVCLDQGWLENAALHLTLTADLDGLARHCGPRAYRYAHLEAGRLGQMTCLGATAKRMGVCGIGAFFDQEAATLLDLPQGHALLYLVAVGRVLTP
ncbi:SagB/ThcOx family dehydrogenase [Pseudodesulfovibrio sp. F-1]|uniref:SagB/ThcOx family dehydrogenase n=1 Tax=Pseudodesulfovibrio alkaliphilus TaxID=2661613 RepID=A0A7K1KNI5_9BACT|nr:SagB family peptide dehydrogenase [Pseudodesulfovibrio alkaliphilus]MUM77649.1 SagB/ThcOx family dehydrogenase [Pseudodesulfovibrio alkaliphilus]